MSKRLPNYTLAVFDAYLCSFFSCWAKHHLITLPCLPDCLSVTLFSPSVAALGIVLTSGCATSRHCQQQELPGVRIHCCDSDLCNSAPLRRAGALHYIGALFSLMLLRMGLWYEQRNTQWTMGEAFFISTSHCWHVARDGADSEWRTPCAQTHSDPHPCPQVHPSRTWKTWRKINTVHYHSVRSLYFQLMWILYFVTDALVQKKRKHEMVTQDGFKTRVKSKKYVSELFWNFLIKIHISK